MIRKCGKRMAKAITKRNLLRAGALFLAALALAACLEWIMQGTLPPVFVDQAVDISADPALIERGQTYLHISGREALREEWHPVRFLAGFSLNLLLLVILWPLGAGRRMLSFLQGTGRKLIKSILTEKKRSGLLLLCFAVTFAAVFLMSRIWILDVYQRDNWMTRMVCVLAGTGAACLTTFRRTLAKKPEILFLVLMLTAGGLLCWILPDATQVSLDDGQHFQHALNYSMGGRVRFTGTDWDVMQMDNSRAEMVRDRNAFLAAQDAKYAEGAVYVTSGFHLNLKEYWMAAHGLGLFLGRLFHLRYWDMWSLGRFTGLLAYSLIGYFAIRRLKSGRMVLALSLMMPSCVFLASNYSYDPGVTAGITLSCAYWIAQWQERTQKLKNRDAAVMIVPMLIACYAKAIYFPLFLLFLFLPAGKFRSVRHRRVYTATVLLAMLAVMLYILLPLSRSGGQGDVRADGQVNTFGQLQFILGNPLTYAEYLWHFLQKYLDPNRMAPLVNAFGYQGAGNSTTLVLLLLAVAAFTDQREEGLLPGTGIRFTGEMLLFGTLVLMVTSMYVWFSEVGSAEFPGVQARYMIPFVYPALVLMGSNRNYNEIHPAFYHGILLAGMTFSVISSTVYTCIAFYP